MSASQPLCCFQFPAHMHVLRTPCLLSADACSLISTRKTNVCFAAACFSFVLIILYYPTYSKNANLILCFNADDAASENLPLFINGYDLQ